MVDDTKFCNIGQDHRTQDRVNKTIPAIKVASIGAACFYDRHAKEKD